MNTREIFDTVKKHLLTQNAKAMENPRSGPCSYLTKDGKMCAIGVLIKNTYLPECEGANTRYLAVVDGKWEARVDLVSSNTLAACLNEAGVEANDINRELLADLQCVHDELYCDLWSRELDIIERKFFGYVE